MFCKIFSTVHPHHNDHFCMKLSKKYSAFFALVYVSFNPKKWPLSVNQIIHQSFRRKKNQHNFWTKFSNIGQSVMLLHKNRYHSLFPLFQFLYPLFYAPPHMQCVLLNFRWQFWVWNPSIIKVLFWNLTFLAQRYIWNRIEEIVIC